MRGFFFLAFIFFFLSQPSVATEKRLCPYPNTKKIIRPIFSEKPNSPHFDYFFQYYPAKTPETPTVVILGGGPGVGLILNWKTSALKNDRRLLGVPKDFGLVFFDPRGMGCNELSKTALPDEALSSLESARDFLAVIEKLQLKNYFIYGHSYGTAVATILSRELEKKDAALPKATLLSGTIHQATSGERGSIYFFLNAYWKTVFKTLSPELKKVILQNPSPFGLSLESWSAFIEELLYSGFLYQNGEWKNPYLSLLTSVEPYNPKSISKFRHLVKKLEQQELNTPSKWSDRLWEYLECNEFTDTEPEMTVLYGKPLPLLKEDICREKKTRTPFYTKNYPLKKIPLIYFQGTQDPATPAFLARAHVSDQSQTLRTYSEIKGAGHLRIGAYFEDCLDLIWETLANENFHALDRVIKSRCEVSRKTYIQTLTINALGTQRTLHGL